MLPSRLISLRTLIISLNFVFKRNFYGENEILVDPFRFPKYIRGKVLLLHPFDRRCYLGWYESLKEIDGVINKTYYL